MSKTIVIPALAAMLATSSLAFASDDDNARRFGISVPRDQWLSIAQVAEKLAGQGYQVRQIEADDGVYEVYAIDGNGARFEAYVHPATGEVLRKEPK